MVLWQSPCNGCMPVRAVCKPHSPDLKRGALATDARGCSLWRSLLERPPPAPESRVRDPLGELGRTRVGGVTPWYSHHVRVFMWARGFECARVARSLICVPCFMLERGVWIPALMSWVSVTWRGSDTRAPVSVIGWVCGLEFARHRALLSTCVLLLHAVRVSIGCVHLCCHVLCEHVAYEFSH